MYDLIIIGLGPAGINAAIYAKRSNLNILVIEKSTPGGKLNSIKEVKNYLGYENIMGPDLAMNFYKQFKSLKVPMVSEEVQDIKVNTKTKRIITDKNEYESKAIIIATGNDQKKLKGFETIKGISYCTLCDANLYQDKEVALVGNNSKAIEEALYLSDIAAKVNLIIPSKILSENILNKENIQIYIDEEISDIKEDNGIISEIILKNTILQIQGLFVTLGNGPATYFCKELGITDDKGYILMNEKCETSIPGIYACGDNVKKEIYQIITAASEGAIAALNANKYIKQF